MAIKNRHGIYDKFVPEKLVPGEFAFVRSGDPNAKDGKSIYASFDAGSTKRLATYEDMKENIALAADDVVKDVVDEVAEELHAATDRANTSAVEAETAAMDATNAAEEAKHAIAGSKSPVYKSDGWPEVGEEGRLYIDDTVSPRLIYTWDDVNGYVLTGGASGGGGSEESRVILIPVEAAGFELNETTGRYEQTISVVGMTEGSGGIWDIVRTGPVLTEEESEIVANITDVERLENGVKISCLEVPTQTYTLVLYGTFVNSGETLVSSMPAWFNRVEAVENKVEGLTSKIEASGFTQVTELSSGAVYNDYGGCYYYKKNNKVHVHIGISGLSANTRHQLFQLPSGYEPYSSVRSCGTGGESMMSLAWIEVNNYGVVFCASSDRYAMCDIEFDLL